MSETDLVRACMDLLEWSGALPIRVNSGVRVIKDENDAKTRVFRGAKAGTSDIIVLYRGRFLAVECKSAGKKPTPKQQAFLERVAQSGGYGLVVYTLDFLASFLQTFALEQDPLIGGIYHESTTKTET